MKRKPDLLWTLVILFGLGVVTTGYAQSLWSNKADAPIMLIHGRDDTVVAYDQSLKMADALKDAGKPYEFVELKGEDHWLSLGETRKAMLEAAVDFVQRHNPAD